MTLTTLLQLVILAGHNIDPDAHHTRYSDPEAVRVMVINIDDNLLHHDRYTDFETMEAIFAVDGSGSGVGADLLDGLDSTQLLCSRISGTPSVF